MAMPVRPMAVIVTMPLPATLPHFMQVAGIRSLCCLGDPGASCSHGLSRSICGEECRTRSEQGHGNEFPHGRFPFLWLVPGDVQIILRVRWIPDHIIAQRAWTDAIRVPTFLRCNAPLPTSVHARAAKMRSPGGRLRHIRSNFIVARMVPIAADLGHASHVRRRHRCPWRASSALSPIKLSAAHRRASGPE